MALHQLTVSLDATTQRVTATRTPCRQVIFSNPVGNAAVAVGLSTLAGTTGTTVGMTLVPSATTPDRQVIGPFESPSINLEDFYVRGTNGQVLNILYEG